MRHHWVHGYGPQNVSWRFCSRCGIRVESRCTLVAGLVRCWEHRWIWRGKEVRDWSPDPSPPAGGCSDHG